MNQAHNFSEQQAGKNVFQVCQKQNKPKAAFVAGTELLLPPAACAAADLCDPETGSFLVGFEESKIENTYMQGITCFFQFPPHRLVGFSSGSLLGLRKEFLHRTFKLLFPKIIQDTPRLMTQIFSSAFMQTVLMFFMLRLHVSLIQCHRYTEYLSLLSG